MADTWYLDYPSTAELDAEETQAINDHRDAIDAATATLIAALPVALEANLAAWDTQRELVAKAQSTLVTTRITADTAANSALNTLLEEYLQALQIPSGESHRMLRATATQFYVDAYTTVTTRESLLHRSYQDADARGVSLSQTRVADQKENWLGMDTDRNRMRSYQWWHDTLMNGTLTAQEMLPTISMQTNPQRIDSTFYGGGGTTDRLSGIVGGDDDQKWIYASPGYVEGPLGWQTRGTGNSDPECANPEFRRANPQKCKETRFTAGSTWHASVPPRGANDYEERSQNRADFFNSEHGTGAFVSQGIYTEDTLRDLKLEPREGEREGFQTGETLIQRSEDAIDKITQGNGGSCNMALTIKAAYIRPIRETLGSFFGEYFGQQEDDVLDAQWTSIIKTPLGGWGAGDRKGKTSSGLAKEIENNLTKLVDTYAKICKVWKDYQAAIQAASEDLHEALKADPLLSLFTVNVGSRFEGEAAVEVALADRLGEEALKNPRTVFENNQERLLYKEQCFLLAYIKLLSQQKKEPGGIDGQSKAIPYEGSYGNATVLIDGDAYGFMNRLTSGKNQAALHNLDSNVISNLQPMIRLFKVTTTESGIIEEQEMVFSPHAGSNPLNASADVVALGQDGVATFSDDRTTTNDLESALRLKGRRGAGVGVQGFSFTYDGSNPFAIKKSIKANLKIFANSFNDLFEDRAGYMYADLALKTGGTRVITTSTTDLGAGMIEGNAKHPCAVDTDTSDRRARQENEELAKLNFRLKAVIGWALPPGRIGGTLMTDAQMDDIRQAIADSYVTLELTPTVHSFDIDEFGRVVMEINYLAYVEDFFDQPTLYNVFAGDPGAGLTKKAVERELKMARFKKECKQEEVAQIKQEWAENIGEEKQQAVQGLLSTLAARQKIYTINLKYDEVRAFVTGGPFYAYHQRARGLKVMNDSANTAQMQQNIAAAMDAAGFSDVQDSDERKTKFRAALFAGGDFDNVSLQFFYLSDLIDIVLVNIERELSELPQQIQQLDPAEVDACARWVKIDTLKKAHRAFKSFRIMLGPVEFFSHAETTSYYANLGDVPISVKYFLEWLTEKMLKKEETIYSLSRFLNDLMNDLVRNFLNNDTCFSINASQKVKLHQASITSYPPARRPDSEEAMLNKLGLPRDELTLGMVAETPVERRANLNWWIDENGDAVPVMNTSGPRGFITAHRPTELGVNYMTYFVGRVQPLDRMRGRREEDEKIGLFHYVLGRDKGLIKNIKLVKTQTPGLQEVRFEQEGYDGLEQLRVVYDVEIETYANVKVYPGTYIFVEPRSFSPGQLVTDLSGNPIDLTKFGLGGYYMVYKVENSFAAGKADTVLHAKWVNQLHKDVAAGRDPDPAADADSQQGRHIYTGVDNTPTRCKLAGEEYQRQLEEAQNAKPPGLGRMLWTGTKGLAAGAWDKITFWN